MKSEQCVWGPVVVAALLASFARVGAEPQPGDVFKEYKWIAGADAGTPGQSGRDWISETVAGGGFGRCGGSADNMKNNRPLPDMDLDGATRAEAMAEKVLCHDNTTGLSISLNDNDFHLFPESEFIPEPQRDYQHHFFPEVEVPVSELKASGNKFKMTVSPESNWNWPQNLIYGVIVRVYYEDSKAHPGGQITSPAAGDVLEVDPELSVETEGGTGGINRVEFIGNYEDFPYRGDGNYHQWQYRWVKGWLKNNIGTATSSPYSVTWENQWVPSQTGAIQLAARIVDGSGMISMTDAVDNLRLGRSGVTVEMCKPSGQKTAWVTRKGTGTETFTVEGDLGTAKAAQCLLAVWQCDYYPSFLINSQNIGQWQTPSLVVNVKSVPPTAFQAGENTITVPGGGHHGTEINWPGIVPFIQYEADEVGAREPRASGRRADPLSLTVTTSGTVVIGMQETAPHQMEVIAPDGRIVIRQHNRGARQYSLEQTRLPAGLYVVRVAAGSDVRTAKFVVGR